MQAIRCAGSVACTIAYVCGRRLVRSFAIHVGATANPANVKIKGCWRCPLLLVDNALSSSCRYVPQIAGRRYRYLYIMYTRSKAALNVCAGPKMITISADDGAKVFQYNHVECKPVRYFPWKMTVMKTTLTCIRKKGDFYGERRPK